MNTPRTQPEPHPFCTCEFSFFNFRFQSVPHMLCVDCRLSHHNKVPHKKTLLEALHSRENEGHLSEEARQWESVFPWRQTVSSGRWPVISDGSHLQRPTQSDLRGWGWALPVSWPSKQHHRLGRKHSKHVDFRITLRRVTYYHHRLQPTYVFWRAADSKLFRFHFPVNTSALPYV